MNEYVTYDLVLGEVDESEALDMLYGAVWGDILTTVQELSDMELITDCDGVTLYYNHVSCTYIFVDDERY